MASTATKLPFLIQIKYDLFFSLQQLIKSISKFMIKQFMKSSKFYQGERRFIFLFKIIVFPVIKQQTRKVAFPSDEILEKFLVITLLFIYLCLVFHKDLVFLRGPDW